VARSTSHWVALDAGCHTWRVPSEVVREPRKWARPTLGLSIAIAVSLVAAGVVGALQSDSRPDAARIPLDQIPQGVTPMSLDGLAAIVIRSEDDTTVFSGLSPRPWQELAWCANVEKFVTLPSDSTFDRSGRKVGGPAPRSLDQFRSRQEGSDLVVSTIDVLYRDVTGETTGPPTAAMPGPSVRGYSPEWEQNFRTPSQCPRG